VAPNSSPTPSWLVGALQQVTGLAVQIGTSPATLSVRAAGGAPVTFSIKTIPVLGREAALELIRATGGQDRSGQTFEGRLLVATRQLTEPVRKLLRSSDISWAERNSGACRLIAPGLLVDIAGDASRDAQPRRVRARLRDRSGLLAETLLQLEPNERFSVIEVARRAKISIALSSRILKRLTDLRITGRKGKGPAGYWQLEDPGALLDLWTTEERIRPRSSKGIYVWSRSPIGIYEKLSSLKLEMQWAVGGISAANLYTPTLTVYPDPVIWLADHIPAERMAEALGGEVADKGANVLIWQSEGDLALQNAKTYSGEPSMTNPFSGLRLVSKPRAYLETSGGTGRAPEVAENLRSAIVSKLKN
jgi:hypothetical protein